MDTKALSGRRRALATALTFVAIACAWALPSTALAATFSKRVPASGAVGTNVRPTVSVKVYDRYGVRPAWSSVFMRVDGKRVFPRVTYSRRGDYRSFTVSYRPTRALTLARHKVVVDVRNRRGRWSTAVWYFKVVPIPVTTSDTRASYEGTATIRLRASTAPIARTYYSLDGGRPVEGTVVVALPPAYAADPAMHTVTYWSVSTAGVVEPPKTATFVVAPAPDMEKPGTSVYGMGRMIDGSYVGTVTVLLHAEDRGGSGVSHTYYVLDGADAVEGTRTMVSPPATGSVSHTVTYWSVDGAGNVEPAQSWTFRVAPMPVYLTPTTTSNAQGGYCGTATIELTAHDDVAAITHTYYRVDGEPVQEGLRIVVLAPEEGTETHTVEFWSEDASGTVETPHNVVTFYVEPNIVYNQPDPHLVTSSCTTAECHSPNVQITHATVTGGPCGVCHSFGMTPTFECATAGCHPDGMPVADTTAPSTAANHVPSYVGTATIILDPADNDGGSGVASTHYRLDHGTTRTGTIAVISPPVSGTVSHSLEYWSVDVAGNAESPRSFAFDVSAAPAAMTFSALTPGDGASVPLRAPVVSVIVTAPADITSVSAKLDGASVVPVVSYPNNRWVQQGYWVPGYFDVDELGEPYWVEGYEVDTSYSVIDKTVVLVTVPAEGLADGAHTVSVTAMLPSGAQATKAWTFSVAMPDTTEPVSIMNTVGAFAGKARFIIVPSDPGGSGVAATYFKVDGGATQAGTVVEIALPESGAVMHTILYWSVDNAGNAEPPRSFSVLLTPTWGGGPV